MEKQEQERAKFIQGVSKNTLGTCEKNSAMIIHWRNVEKISMSEIMRRIRYEMKEPITMQALSFFLKSRGLTTECIGKNPKPKTGRFAGWR